VAAVAVPRSLRLRSGDLAGIQPIALFNLNQRGPMRLLVVWLINAVALLALPYLMSSVQVDSFWIALLAALVLGLINTFIRPILLLLTLPATVLTLGLFIFVVNAICFGLTAALVPGFALDGLLAAFLGALVVTIVSWFLSALLPDRNDRS